MEIQTLVNEICPTTTQEWMKNDTLLIEVCENDEVAGLSYDVPNIMNIPLSEFEKRYTGVPKDQEVVMDCKSGIKSLKTAVPLANHIYGKVKSKQHGIDRWIQHEFPTKGDTNTLTYNDTCCSIPSYY